MKIAIDIGHAEGTGARGNGLEEHAVCVKLALLLGEELERAGHTVKVFDFPDCSNGEDLRRTASAVNNSAWDMGISLHCDCSDSPAPHGAHVCYLSEAGCRLAEAIAGPLCELLPGRASQTVKRDDLYILRHTRPVWVLIECGFISNLDDSGWIHNYPGRIASAIVNGIKSYES